MPRRIPVALALALPFLPHAAASQGLTSAELWTSWQAVVASSGGKLSAMERREGNRLVLDDLTLLPDAGAEDAIHLETLTLVSQADGSVAVVLPERFALTVTRETGADTGDDPDGEPPASDDESPLTTVTFSVAAPDLDLLILGLGQKAEFQASGPSVSVTLDRIDPPLPEGTTMIATAAAADLSLRYKHELGVQLPAVDTAFEIGSLHLDIEGGAKDQTVSIAFDGAALSLALQAMVPQSAQALVGPPGGDSPQGPEIQPILKALSDGFLIAASIGVGETTIATDMNTADTGKVRADLALGSGKAGFRLDRTILGWDTALNGFSARVAGTDPAGAPVDGGLTLDEYRTALSVGLNGFAGPQSWALAWVLRNAALDDAAWSLLDKTGLLDNTPITLAVDLAGQYALDPAALAPGWKPEPAAPPPLTGLDFTITELLAQGLGVTFSGSGGLSFDFADLQSFDGVPAPAGRLLFITKGAYALLDKLSALGLVSADEASNARYALLMLGMAADEPDTLTTDVDFRDRSLFLNGQKIR